MSEISIAKTLHGIRVLLVAPSLDILGGQAVQADLLLRNFRNEKVEVDLLPINPVPFKPLHYLTKIKYVRTLVVSIFYLVSLLWRVRQYDIIHVFSASYFSFLLAPTPAILIARLYGKKIILNYRSGEAEDHFQRWGRSIFWIIQLVDKIVVPSGYLVEVFSKFGFRAEAIFNISDFDAFRFRRRTPILPKIIVPRNLEPLYDIETSIRAFVLVKKKFPEARLTIAGYGSDEKRLKELVGHMSIKDVVFTGRVERSKMPELLDDADIFLNSSIIDNMPVAVIEAFSAGLPVVTTDAGGIPYIVDDRKSGMLLSCKDFNGLSNAICEVIDTPLLRETIVDGGLDFSRKCSWDLVKFQWAKVYRQLAARNG